MSGICQMPCHQPPKASVTVNGAPCLVCKPLMPLCCCEQECVCLSACARCCKSSVALVGWSQIYICYSHQGNAAFCIIHTAASKHQAQTYIACSCSSGRRIARRLRWARLVPDAAVLAIAKALMIDMLQYTFPLWTYPCNDCWHTCIVIGKR